MAKPTLTSRVEGLESKIDLLLELLAGRDENLAPPDNTVVIAEDDIPEGNPIEYPPDLPTLTVVPDPEPSVLGEAFRTRFAAPESVRPDPGEIEWEPVGDTQMVVAEPSRGAGHRLTDAQINDQYLRDQQARRRPGPTVEDQNAAALAKPG